MIPRLSLIFGLVLMMTGWAAQAENPPEGAVKLVFFSSYPEIMQPDGRVGYSELATAVQALRAQNPDTYLISGGASLGPSVLGPLDHGAHMVDILNAVQPEFMAVMKKEFSYGFDRLIVNARASAFPYISSNLKDSATGGAPGGIEADYLLETGSLKIGFIAVTSPNAILEYGATEVTARAPEDVIAPEAAALRALGADAIILIADTDFDDMGQYRESGAVDAIFYTHNFGNPLSMDHQGQLHVKGPLDGVLLSLDLWRGEDGKLRTKGTEIELSTFGPDPAIASLIDSYRARLAERLSPPVATLETSFDTLRANVRSGENAFGNFAADVLRTFLEADVFLLNSGAIRGNRHYEAGSVLTRGDIQREMPFGNRTAVVKLRGADLRAALEYGLDCAARIDGCALQVSNIVVRFDPAAPKGAKIRDISIGGQPLDDKRLYLVGMSDFLAAGNDGFTWFKGAEPVARIGAKRAMWDVVAEMATRQQTIRPKVDGRFLPVDGSR